MDVDMTAWSKAPNWRLRHYQDLPKSIILLWEALIAMRDWDSCLVEASYSDLSRAAGISKAGVGRGLPVIMKLGGVTKHRSATRNQYVVHLEPPEVRMVEYGSDPEAKTRVAKPTRERVHGGTDQVEPEPKPPRGTSAVALARYFDRVVVRTKLFRDPQPRAYHYSEKALARNIKKLMTEGDVSPEQVRRMIDLFAMDLDSQPLREGQQAWMMFVYKRWQLRDATKTRQSTSDIDYAETRIDPWLLEDEG